MASTTTATLNLSEFQYTKVIEGPATITHNEYGSVTVDGTTVSNGGSTSTITSDGAQLVATPISGASFVAWVNKDDNTVLSQDASYTLYPYAANMNVWAIFTTASQTPYYKVGTTLHTDLDDAISAASSGSDKKIVLISDGTMPSGETYTIPSGLTLLVPYAQGETTVDTTTNTVDGGDSTYIHANKRLVNSNTNSTSSHFTSNRFNMSSGRYLTLTVPSGTTIENSGLIAVGGTLGYVNGNGAQNITLGGSDSVSGDYYTYSVLQLNDGAKINVTSTGNMSVCGYVLGNGTINVSGGKLYQPLAIHDYWGGAGTVAAAGLDNSLGTKTDESYLPAFTVYTMQNVQSNVKYSNGGSSVAYAAMYTGAVTAIAAARYNVTDFAIIGTSGALITTNSGTVVTTSYNSSAAVTMRDGSGGTQTFGKTTVTITGGASFGAATMKISLQGTEYSLNSNDVTWAVPFCYDFNLNGSGSEYSIPYSLALLPGASMTVDEGATLNVGSSGTIFAVYDGLYSNWTNASGTTSASVTTSYSANTSGASCYPATTTLNSAVFNYGTAELRINGTLNVNAGNFGGTIQTDGTGKVVFGSGATASCTTQCGRVGTVRYIKAYAYAGATVTTLPAQLYMNNTLTTITPGTTYYGLTGNNYLDSFDFTLYTSSDGTTTSDKTVTFASCGVTAANTGGEKDGMPIAGNWCTVENHNYGEIEYVWNEEFTSCIATRACQESACGYCETTEATAIDSSVTVAASCEIVGEMTYTATFAEDVTWVEMQTTTAEIAALGHKYTVAEDGYAWAEDYSKVTASGTCENDESHTTTVDSEKVESVTTAATCSAEGSIVYTATFAENTEWTNLETQTATVTLEIDSTAHADENKDHKCDYCSTETSTCVDANTDHACDYTGCSIYQGEHSDSNADHKCDYGCTTAIGDHTDADLNHVCDYGCSESIGTCEDADKDHYCDYGAGTEGGCSAYFGEHKDADSDKDHICDYCESSEVLSACTAGEGVTEKEAAATCTAGGSYDTVTYCTECGEEMSRVTTTVDALTHYYGDATYTWSDDVKSCTATHSCTRTGCTHSETATASVEGKVTTAATCTVMGTTTYTATFSVDWATEQTTTRQDVAVIAHTYDQQNTADTYKATDATCTAAATYYYSCSCGAAGTETFEHGEANGHTPGAEATCTAAQTCTVCGAELTAKLGHNYESVVTAPTCTAGGYTTHTCNRCSDSYTDSAVAANGHNLGEWIVDTAATCTVAGSQHKECANCDYTESGTIEALGHDEETHAAQAPTCTAIGWDAYVTCSRCDYSTYAEKAALGHTEVLDAAVAATCTATGLTEGSHCSVCSEVLVAQTVVDALGHSYDAVVTAPTCEAGGYTTYTCSVCGDTYTADEVAATGHSYSAVVTAPTCTAGGYTTYTCSACGDSYTADETAAVGHTYGTVTYSGDGKTEYKAERKCACGDTQTATASITSTVTKEATCTAAGVRTYTATFAEDWATGTTTTEEITKLDHSYSTEWSYGDDSHWHECSCGEKSDEAAHSHTSEVTKAATCTEAGETTYTCSCGHSYTEAIEATGHKNTVTVNAKDATCGAAGYTGDTYCNDCQTTIATGTAIEATGNHSYEWETTTAATCVAKGVETGTCSCGATTTREIAIDPDAHDLVTVAAKAATCTEKGWEAYEYCDRVGCNHTTYVEIPATGHTAVTDAAVEATCTATGLTEGSHCSVCDEVIVAQEEVEAKGHADADNDGDHICDRDGCSEVVTTCADNDADHKCDECGETMTDCADGDSDHKCDTCDKVMSECSGGTATCEKKAVCTVCGAEYGDLAAHTPGEAVKENEVPATCGAAGSYDLVVYCTVCKAEVSRQNASIEASGHSYGNPSYTWNGTTLTVTLTCGNCAEGTEDRVLTGSAEGTVESSTEGTCQAAATTTYTATVTLNGKDYTDETTIKGELGNHSYVDGTCSVCGEADPDVSTTTKPTVTVTNPANGTVIAYDIVEAESGWTLTLTAADTVKTYVYLVKYTDASGNVSEKVANASGKYTGGEFAIPEEAKSVSVESALMGDVYQDGKVNVTDAQEVHKAAVRMITLSELAYLAADVDSSGKVNVTDAQKIHQYAVRMITTWD